MQSCGPGEDMGRTQGGTSVRVGLISMAAGWMWSHAGPVLAAGKQ